MAPMGKFCMGAENHKGDPMKLGDFGVLPPPWGFASDVALDVGDILPGGLRDAQGDGSGVCGEESTLQRDGHPSLRRQPRATRQGPTHRLRERGTATLSDFTSPLKTTQFGAYLVTLLFDKEPTRPGPYTGFNDGRGPRPNFRRRGGPRPPNLKIPPKS